MVDNSRIYELVKKIKKSPLVLQGIILQILQNWFASNSDQFKFSHDPNDNKLVIEPSHKWNPENCQNRPGLYVKRLGFTPKGMGRVGADDVLRFKKDAGIQYTILPVCGLVIFCVSKLPGEVETLAWEAAEVLIAMAPIIKRDFVFTAFDVDQVGEIGQIKEFKEFWTVPISLTTKFSESWEVKEAAPILKDTLMNVYTTLVGELRSGFQDKSSGYSNKSYS